MLRNRGILETTSAFHALPTYPHPAKTGASLFFFPYSLYERKLRSCKRIR